MNIYKFLKIIKITLDIAKWHNLRRTSPQAGPVWDVKRKPRLTADASPIDVFPAYDEQPDSSTDDYIRNPDYPVEAYF